MGLERWIPQNYILIIWTGSFYGEYAKNFGSGSNHLKREQMTDPAHALPYCLSINKSEDTWGLEGGINRLFSGVT